MIILYVVCRIVHFSLIGIGLIPNGVCALKPLTETGLTILGVEIVLYAIIGIHFSYAISKLMVMDKGNSIKIRRLSSISNILFILVIIIKISLYPPYVYGVLGSYSVCLASFLAGFETWVLNLSFDMTAEYSQNSTELSVGSSPNKVPVASNKLGTSSIA